MIHNMARVGFVSREKTDAIFEASDVFFFVAARATRETLALGTNERARFARVKGEKSLPAFFSRVHARAMNTFVAVRSFPPLISLVIKTL
jgi:hypothetical protein